MHHGREHDVILQVIPTVLRAQKWSRGCQGILPGKLAESARQELIVDGILTHVLPTIDLS